MLNQDDRSRLGARGAAHPPARERGRARARWSAIGAVLAIVIGTLATLLGMTVLESVPILFSVPLAAIGWIWLLSSRRARRTPEGDHGGPPC